MGRCMYCRFLLLVTYVSLVPITKHIFVLHVLIISHVRVSCFQLFVGIDSSESILLHVVEDYDVDVRNIDNGVVDIRNNVVDKCCKQSKTQVDLRYVSTTNMLE